MKKRILTLFCMAFLVVSMLPTEVHATQLEEIITGTLTHTHTGANGNCYITQQTHSHGWGCYHHCSGSSSGGGGCYGSPNYHSHSGSSSSGGGCYGKANTCNRTSNTVSMSVICSCGATVIRRETSEVHSACGKGSVLKKVLQNCTSCGNNQTSQGSVSTGSHTYSYSRNCGKSTSTIESYSKSCGMSDGQQTCTTATHSRVLNCSNSNVGKTIANYSIKKERHGGVYQLTLDFSDKDSFFTLSSYAWESTTNAPLDVTANKTYTLTITYTDNGQTKTKQESIVITDYDDIKPEINETITTPTFTITDSNGNVFWGRDVKVEVFASDNFSGVVEYSKDGVTWQSDPVLTFTSNGTYSVYAKDACGNISEGKLVTITNIDQTAPTVTINPHTPSAWTNQPVTVTYGATDNVDTSTFTYFISDNPALTDINGAAATIGQVSQNGTFYVYAKDSCGNIGKSQFTVTNIDTEAPSIHVTSYPTDLRREELDITYSATDNSNDTIFFTVSELDNLGVEDITGFETSYTIRDNGTYYIYAKDLAGNIAKEALIIDFFDLTPPVITIEPYDTNYRKDDLEIQYSAVDETNCTIRYAFSEVNNLSITDITSYETSSTISDNGIYYVYAMDSVGNIAKEQIVIDFFDHEPPRVLISVTPHDTFPDASAKLWTAYNTVNVTATDNIAMHETSYSYNGEEYCESATWQVEENGSFVIIVRDSVGNETRETISIDNVDTVNPSIGAVTFSYYENGEYIDVERVSDIPSTSLVAFKASASDNQSGIPRFYIRTKFILDGEEIYTDWQNEITDDAYLNGEYTIQIRDNCDNITETTVSLDMLTEMFEVEIIDGDNDGLTLGKTIITKPYGSIVYGSEIGHDTAIDKYYENYQYVSCDSCTVSYKDNKIYRYFDRPVYNINYYDENKNLVNTQQVKHGNSALYVPTPYKEELLTPLFVYSYTFEKWVDADGNNVNLSKIYSDLFLYPIYAETENDRLYTVTFYDAEDNILSIQKVLAGENANPPEAPEKYGSIFVQWDNSYSAVMEDLEIRPYYVWTLGTNVESGEPHIVIEEEVVEDSGFDSSVYEDIIVEDVGGEVEYLYPSQSTDLSKDPDKFDINAIMGAISDKLNSSNEEDDASPETISKVVLTSIESVTPPLFGFTAAYGILTAITHVCTGAGALQCGAFGYAYLAKKVRYMQGAWLTSSDGVKYVDSLGRKVDCVWNEAAEKYEFFRGKKKLETADVDELIKSLNQGDITFEAFEKEIKKSKVYTSFSKDLEIEVQNVKLSSGISRKAKGLSLTDNISKMMDVAGDYSVRLTNKGKSAIFEIKYAMKQI